MGWIARLKGNAAAPAALGEKGSHLGGVAMVFWKSPRDRPACQSNPPRDSHVIGSGFLELKPFAPHQQERNHVTEIDPVRLVRVFQALKTFGKEIIVDAWLARRLRRLRRATSL